MPVTDWVEVTWLASGTRRAFFWAEYATWDEEAVWGTKAVFIDRDTFERLRREGQ